MANNNPYTNYDFSRFETPDTAYDRNAARKLNTAPATEKQPQMHLVKTPKRGVLQIKREMNAAAIRTVKALCVAVALLMLLSFSLYSRLRVDELGRDLNKIQQSMAVAKSENTRLNAAVDSMISMDRVESYAKDQLGMVKLESHQIEYIDLSKGDAVVVSGNKTPEKTAGNSALAKFWEYLRA